MAYARVAVNVPTLSGEFDYHLPDELAGRVIPGCLVSVQFGRQTVQGVVLELVAVPAVAETKPVLELLDPQPVVTVPQIVLAKELSERFLSPLAGFIDLLLPPGLGQQADTLYQKAAARQKQDLSATQMRILKLLDERGPLRGRQIERHFRNVDWRKSAEALVRSGVLTRQSVLPPPSVRPKTIRSAQLAVSPEQAEAAMQSLGRTEATQSRREAALRFLMHEPGPVDVTWIYAGSGCKLADLQELAERELVLLQESEVWRDPVAKVRPEDGFEIRPELTKHQQRAWETIRATFEQRDAGLPVQSLLLHGVTGSGKTELYIRSALEADRRGRQSLILVPEIALTPQTVRRFLAVFPGRVGLIHSKLSPGERYDTWRRARSGRLAVIIGPRSALFTPLPDIGFIAIDECHDGSYYQSEPPFYHAVTAAQAYARLCGAVCLLGSATPTIVQRHLAETGESVLLELPERIVQSGNGEAVTGLPPIQVVDMRQELTGGNRGIFSHLLVETLAGVLARGEQAILFLNRRGTATYVFCRECGYAAICPQCDSPLTYHTEHVDVTVLARTRQETLFCHRCGYTRQMLEVCPQCRGNQIRTYGLGSEKVEAELRSTFPRARTLRWDWETTRQKDAHEIILSHFAAGRADVLVGTQMLAKGLDLPRVTLVGIVLADTGLNLPDPYAAERTFAVLTQVAGRAGRSERGGRVILQTYQPEHYAIQHAAGHDYSGFYQRELSERRNLAYPPFNRLVRLETRHMDAVKVEEAAQDMAAKLRTRLTADARKETTLIGPTPCFFSRMGGLYRWQIILRGPDPASILEARPIPGWRVEVEPVSLL